MNNSYSKKLIESVMNILSPSLEEGVEDVKNLIKNFKVGDTTNFGKVLEIGSNSITFKAKDLPKTQIPFNQRKMGSSEFLLTKLIKLKEETEVSEKNLKEAYKPLRKPEDLVAELQTIVDAPDSKLWDVTSVSIRLSHEDIFDRFPKIYDYVEDMWFAIMQPNGARKTKEIAKKAIEAVHKFYPVKEETELVEKLTNQDVFLAGKNAKLDTSEISKLLQQALKKFNNAEKARQELVFVFNSIKNNKKDLSKFYSDFSSLYNAVYEETESSEETLDEAINWLGDYLPTSEKSKFGGYLPKIINKKTKGLMYQSAAAYNTPEEAKDHAEDYLKQKSKGIKNPKVPVVGTYKENVTSVKEEDSSLKRSKKRDMARVNAGVMTRDEYNKKYKLGKYSKGGNLSGPGGVYKNLVKKEAIEQDPGEYDFEGSMAKNALRTIIRNAKGLHDMLADDENLPEHIQANIVKAEESIVNARDYIESQKEIS